MNASVREEFAKKTRKEYAALREDSEEMKVDFVTLEEARNADLLLHIVDVSHEEYRYMVQVTEETLQAVGVEDIPTLYVYNKCDLTDKPYPVVSGDHIWLAAKEGAGLDELLAIISQHVFANYVKCELLVPYDRGEVVAYLNENAAIQSTDYEEDGTRILVELNDMDAKRFSQYMQ